MNLALFRHQLRKLLRRGRLIGLGLLAAVPALVIFVVGSATGSVSNQELVGIVATVGATTFPIAALILAGATLRDEKDDGTLAYLYLAPIPRPIMALTSIGAAVAATALVGLGAAALVLVAGLAVGADLAVGLATFPLYLVTAVGYSALFVPVGYLIPRVILTGLGYVIVWEQIVARLVTGVANTSVWRFGLSIYSDIIEGGGNELTLALGPVTPGTWGGITKVAAVLTIGWSALTYSLHRRDAL